MPHTQEEEARLISAAQTGDKAAFEGYLAPATLFTLCMSLREKLGIFNLFSLAKNSLTGKY